MARSAAVQHFGNPVINAVSSSLQAMGVEQYLMAFLFLACYSMALSQFIGVRGRRYSVAGAVTAAIAFASFTDPWEHGVMVVAVALVAIGGFAVLAWGVWALLNRDMAGHPLSPEGLPAAPSFDGPLPTRPARLPLLR